MSILRGKKILIGVTGSIASYKTCELVRRLKDLKVDVQVAMTKAAVNFIGPEIFHVLSGKDTLTELFHPFSNMQHIQASRDKDLILIVPATANFIAKIANGIADDILSSICLASTCPITFVPSMNVEMWSNHATRRNIATLRKDGCTFFGPDTGHQACGEFGLGRMLEIEQIISALPQVFQKKHMLDFNIIITAGPTIEPIDPVRFISNRSSGKTGYAIAQAAKNAGANVTLITGPVCITTALFGIKIIKVQTALQMKNAVINKIKNSKIDIFISVAAVSDWKPKNYSINKIKRKLVCETFLELSTNVDILSEVSNLRDSPWCIGFAAETQDLVSYSKQKIKEKNLPLIIGNLVHDSLDSNYTKFVLIDNKYDIVEFPKLLKYDAAEKLILEISKRFNEFKLSQNRIKNS